MTIKGLMLDPVSTRAGRRQVAGRDDRGGLELVAHRAGAIDDHELAMAAQRDDLGVVLDQEALQEVGVFVGLLVENRDEHADLEVRGERSWSPLPRHSKNCKHAQDT